MRKNGSNQITNMIQFSLEAVDAMKVSPDAEIHNWNPYDDRVEYAQMNKLPAPTQVVTNMVPCPKCTWG